MFLTSSSSICDRNKCKQKELATFPIHYFYLKSIHIRRYLVVNFVSGIVAVLVLFS